MARKSPAFHVAFGSPTDPTREIQPEDWLNVRRSTGAEIKLAGLKRWHNASTFSFRACDVALPLVVGQPIRPPAGAAKVRMPFAIRDLIDRKGKDVEDAYSTHLFGLVMLLAPQAVAELEKIRPATRCEGCRCVFRNGGPLDQDSDVRNVARDMALSADVLKRKRATSGHGATPERVAL